MGVAQTVLAKAFVGNSTDAATALSPEIRKKEEFVGLTVGQVKNIMGLDKLPDEHNETEMNSLFAQAFIKALAGGIQVKFWGAKPCLIDEKYKREKKLVVPRLIALHSIFHEFAKDGVTTQAAVDKLFTRINGKLWEMSDLREEEEVPFKGNELPVVLGGKPHVQGSVKQSISEAMVDMLLDAGAQHIVTASRSSVEGCDSKVTHISGVDLFGAKEEYTKVIDAVYEKWKALSPHGLNKIRFYFTLGNHGKTAHDRIQAAQNNIKAADSLSAALKDLPQEFPKDKVRIVVTGTDATNPSTMCPRTGVPVYKIGNPNFFYAMSKLAQEHVLAIRVLEMNNQTAPSESIEDLQWMKDRICALTDETDLDTEGFDNGQYKERLDRIAEQQNWMETVCHFRVVKHLSIVFTAMHSHTFAKDAETAAVPAVSVLCNIVHRLQNAVALQEAALMHLLRQQAGSSVVLTPSDD